MFMLSKEKRHMTTDTRTLMRDGRKPLRPACLMFMSTRQSLRSRTVMYIPSEALPDPRSPCSVEDITIISKATRQ